MSDAAVVPKSLVCKLAAVMDAISSVPKRGHNKFHDYKYATEADIVEAIRGELSKRHIILVPGITGRTRVKVGDKGSVLTHLDMTFTFMDGETGEQIERPWLGAGTDKEDKGAYKAMTGGEKYFLLKTFLIPTGDDPEQEQRNDGRSERGKQPRRPITMPSGARVDPETGEQIAAAPKTSAVAVIDAKQQQELIDTAKQAGWTKDALQAFVKDNYTAWSKMPAADFETVRLKLRDGIDTGTPAKSEASSSAKTTPTTPLPRATGDVSADSIPF
jgi:hypothetical protein